MAAQLGGAIAYDSSEKGLVVTLRMGKDRLAHALGRGGLANSAFPVPLEVAPQNVEQEPFSRLFR